ncbi:uncharacterized protein BYT42DRAFT_488932 [Radiomyces spectabilis]|uniref:uncharacterized protein n=1 Tax=Radiomyces spectabilis TaxID=64574 RepID=UPI002220858B|nr:uncharacterized protein BYT42DRAFT_488932 [Radiomyces spectabilis]KAI8393669.1 hypothetical protein BYT42DRAFT_488932 [Radiomyces spectabilis]
MSNSTFYDWRSLQEEWIHHYQALDPSAGTLIRNFFEPASFFAENTFTSSIPLCIGNTQTERTAIIISADVCERLRRLVGSTIQGWPAPSMPTFHDDYKDIQPSPVGDKNMYSRLLQKVKKRNKTAETLRKAVEEWQTAKNLVQAKQHVFISIDIEAYEIDHSILLEIGWSMYDSKNDKYLDQHYLNNAYRHLNNGKYVDDMKLRFMFGTSVWCNFKQALAELRKDLDWAVARDGGFVLVGHGLDSDLKYLRKQNFMWPGRPGQPDTMDVSQSAVVTILNTDTIFGATIRDMHNPPSLGRTLTLLNIDTWCLHNAGNDAHYTLVLLMALVGKA